MVAIAVVALELVAISYIRYRYMDTPFLSAAFQVVLGGTLVFLAGILIGSFLDFTHDIRAGAFVGSASCAAAAAAASQLIGKRATGLVNWRRKRKRSIGRRCWRASSPTSRRRTRITSRSPAISSIWRCRRNTRRRAPGSTRSGSPAGVTLVPGNHDAYVRSGVAASRAHWGDYMCGDEAAAVPNGFPFLRRRGPLALIGVSTSVPSLPLMAIGRVGSDQLAAPRKNPARLRARRPVSRRAHPPSADQQALALSEAAHRRRAPARRARPPRRRAGDPRPQPSPPDRLARRTERPHSRDRRAVGVGSAARRARSRRLQSLSHRR